MPKKKLAIITSHPIQYNAPLFKLLYQRDNIESKVFYTWGTTVLENKFDPGFGKVIQWDIPLLEGYKYEFAENIAGDKGTHHFKGIINPGLIEQIDLFEPDALLVFGWSFHSHLKILRHYHKKKLVLFRGDSTLLDKSSFFKKQLRFLFLRWVYRHIDYGMYVGLNNYEYFKKMGLADSQLVYAPHAIDNERFSDQAELNEAKAAGLRKQMGIGPDETVFLFAGKLEEVKNIDVLLEAFVQSGLHKKTHLVIVGNGNLESKLKQGFQDINSIHFMDFQNQLQMPVIYRIADVFILPSKSETWGLSVNEAMACKRAVIVSDRCGCAPDLVQDGKNGYIFKSSDSNDLAKKMLLLESGKQSLKNMGENAFDSIGGFSFQKICEAIEQTVLSN